MSLARKLRTVGPARLLRDQCLLSSFHTPKRAASSVKSLIAKILKTSILTTKTNEKATRALMARNPAQVAQKKEAVSKVTRKSGGQNIRSAAGDGKEATADDADIAVDCGKVTTDDANVAVEYNEADDDADAVDNNEEVADEDKEGTAGEESATLDKHKSTTADDTTDAAVSDDKEATDAGKEEKGAVRRSFSIDRGYFELLLRFVDPKWVDKQTNFGRVTGKTMATYMGIIDKLNKFKSPIAKFPLYANAAREWCSFRHQCKARPEQFDAELLRIMLRLALGREQTKALLGGVYLGEADKEAEKVEKNMGKLASAAAQEKEKAMARLQRHVERAAAEHAKLPADVFATAGVTKDLLSSILGSVDPTLSGGDTPEYVKGMARVCAYMKIVVPADSLIFREDPVLMTLWAETYAFNQKLFHSSTWCRTASDATYGAQDLEALFGTIQRIKNDDYQRFCMIHKIRIDVSALLKQGSAQSLARAYMLLAGYDNLRTAANGIVWARGDSWVIIFNAEQPAAPYWAEFKQNLEMVLREAIVCRELNLDNLVMRLSSASFLTQICTECRPMIAAAEITRKVKQESLRPDVRQFLAESCVVEKGSKESSSALFVAYQSFCASKHTSESFNQCRTFAKHLCGQSDLFHSVKSHGLHYIRGVRIKQ
jgi:hypothetical protein